MTSAADLPVRKVAAATGIDPATLRVWERRYGRPAPRRTASGQRRYSAADVAYLRLVASGLRSGRRPSELLAAGPDELRALVDAPDAAPPAQGSGPARARWLAAALALDADGLRAAVRAEAARRTTVELLDGVVGPFLAELGTAWAEGTADVHHEHLATAVLVDELARLRARAADAPERPGPRFLLTTLPDERHELGLAMAATQLAERGLPHALLGPDVPTDRIARAADELDAGVVALSVSLASAGVATERAVRALRALLPEHVELWLGGAGARGRRRRPRGVRAFPTLAAFADALDSLPQHANGKSTS